MTDAVDAGAALCAPFLSGLPVTGLSISVVSARGAQSTVGSSDRVAARLDELQFELGEGPTPDAIRSGSPALAPDLQSATARRVWPMFTVAALDTGARGVFSFPMTVERSIVGAVSLYAAGVLPAWTDVQIAAAAGLVDAAARSAVELATRSAVTEAPSGPPRIELRREVHQAAGMLTVQLDCSIEEALARLRAHAFMTGRPIDVVAREIVAGTLDFRSLDD